MSRRALKIQRKKNLKPNGNSKTNKLHRKHPTQQFWNASAVLNTASKTEVDASSTSYTYNCNCNRSALTKKYNRKARISHKRCTRSRGCRQNLLEDLRKTETCDGPLSGKPNKKMRSNSVTQTIKDLRRLVVSYNITDRPYWKGSLVRHHEVYSKKKVNFSFDITADASTIRFFVDI